jgi:hypothetical protein
MYACIWTFFHPLKLYGVCNSCTIINGCVYAFELLCCPFNLSRFTTIGTLLMAYVCAFELRSTQLNLFQVCNSWSIISDLCVCASDPRSTQLNIFRVYSAWNIINNHLCVRAFEPKSTQLNFYRVCNFGASLATYVCVHFNLGIPNWSFLGCVALGASLMAYVCVRMKKKNHFVNVETDPRVQ